MSLTKTLTPFMSAPASSPNYLSKNTPPNTTTLSVKILTYEFWGTHTFSP